MYDDTFWWLFQLFYGLLHWHWSILHRREVSSDMTKTGRYIKTQKAQTMCMTHLTHFALVYIFMCACTCLISCYKHRETLDDCSRSVSIKRLQYWTAQGLGTSFYCFWMVQDKRLIWFSPGALRRRPFITVDPVTTFNLVCGMWSATG